MEFQLHIIFIFVISLFKMTQGELRCGRPIENEFRLEEDRVVGGSDIGYYRYPWFAVLVLATNPKQLTCGATLIGPKTLVTAATCYKPFFDSVREGLLELEDVYLVKLGVYNICIKEQRTSVFDVDKVHIHELYYTKMPYYDISLIKLSEEANAYRPICLPPPNTIKKPIYGTVIGLGKLSSNAWRLPCTIQEARLLIHNSSECISMLNKNEANGSLLHDAFCAGYIQGGIDSCQGDTGGPLQYMKENGDYVLIGIISFGFGCAKTGALGIYTDVSRYLNWIQETSGLE